MTLLFPPSSPDTSGQSSSSEVSAQAENDLMVAVFPLLAGPEGAADGGFPLCFGEVGGLGQIIANGEWHGKD